MPDRLLLLSRKPLRERPLHRWLGDATARTVLLTVPSAIAGFEDVAHREFLDCQVVADYLSWSTEWTAEQAARAHGVTLIASSSEDDVLRCARLRHRLRLRGQSIESATAYRDKLVMKRLATAAGIAVPAFSAVDRPSDLLDFLAACDGPVVIKPRREAGSVGVSMIRTAADAEAFLRAGALPAAPARPGYWMVEKFVDAPFFHVDGVTVAGRVLHCWPARYSSGNAEAVRTESPLSSVLLAPQDPRTPVLRDFAAAVHRALPAPPLPTSFHLEAWVGPDQRPVLCEVACRVGGCGIPATYESAFGVHLSKESLRGQCGLQVSMDRQPGSPGRPAGWVTFPRGHGRFVPPASPAPFPGAQITLRMSPGEVASGVDYIGHSAADAVVSADTAGQVQDRLGQISAWWLNECAWR
jgi:biotin carboxylase